MMPKCRGVGESRIYSKRAKKSPFAGFVPQSGITGSIILVESPSTTEFNHFFSLFCTTSSRRLSVFDYSEFPKVSKNGICCVVGSRSLKSSHGDSYVKYF